MRLTHLSVAVALAIGTSSAAQAQQFSRVVSFGDSLSDAGNVALADGNPATLVGSSFTTNPDNVFAQTLSTLLGLPLQTNSLSGGSNFAYGGACAISNGSAIAVALPGLPTFVCSNSPSTFSLSTQISTHLTAGAGRADPNALYTYWAGANDILSATAITPPGGFLPNGSILYQYIVSQGPAAAAANGSAIAQTIAGQSGATAAAQVKALQAAGAKTIVVFNLPDLGVTPLNLGTANAAGASALTSIYNLQFSGNLANAADGLVVINTYGIINEIRANPAAFGFTNITGVACPGGVSSLACGTGTGYVVAPVSQTYLFADSIHPSGRAHALLANVTYATVTAPALVSLAPEVAIQSAFSHNAGISDALDSEWAAGSEVGKVRGFATVQFGQNKIKQSASAPGLDGDSMNLNVGATYRMSEAATFGVAATLGNNQADAGSQGSFEGNTTMLGIFGQYEINGLYGRASISGGSTDMDIDRNIDLLGSTRIEGGSTSITHQSYALEIGYVFKGENVAHGPFAGVEANNMEVEGYVEGSLTSTAMRFDSFKRDSNMSSIGYQFSGEFGKFKPFIRAAWVNENNDDQTTVRGGTAAFVNSFSLGGYIPSSESYIDVNLGASLNFSEGFDGYISYRARATNDNQSNDTVNVGIRKTF